MILIFDEESFTINIKEHALKEYIPTEEVKELVAKSDLLKEKVEKKQKEVNEDYLKFLKEEVNSEKTEIINKVNEINIKNHPKVKNLNK